LAIIKHGCNLAHQPTQHHYKPLPWFIMVLAYKTLACIQNLLLSNKIVNHHCAVVYIYIYILYYVLYYM